MRVFEAVTAFPACDRISPGVDSRMSRALRPYKGSQAHYIILHNALQGSKPCSARHQGIHLGNMSEAAVSAGVYC